MEMDQEMGETGQPFSGINQAVRAVLSLLKGGTGKRRLAAMQGKDRTEALLKRGRLSNSIYDNLRGEPSVFTQTKVFEFTPQRSPIQAQ
jgi:hypothetical protein